MPWQSEEDVIQLSDFEGCTLETADGRVVSCANPLTPRPVASRPPSDWVCVGGQPRPSEPFGFRVYRENGSGRMGLSYRLDMPADRYTGWLHVADPNDEVVYNVTSEHAEGFIEFAEVTSKPGERARIRAQLADVRYDTSTEVLGTAEKHPTWIPSNGSRPTEAGFDWWLVHAFETGDKTYTFTRQEPRNMRIEGQGVDLVVDMSSRQVDWNGSVLAPSEPCQ